MPNLGTTPPVLSTQLDRPLTLFPAVSAIPALGKKVTEWSDERGLVARAYVSGDYHFIDWQGVGVFAFTQGSPVVQVWPERNASPQSVSETFSRAVRPIILQATGWQVLHAGGVVTPKGAIAFCGKKRSGKSTLAFALHRRGFHQVADDALLLRPNEDRVTIGFLPFFRRLRSPTADHFRHVAEGMVGEVIASQVGAIPLIAIFQLRHRPELAVPTVTRMRGADAYTALLAHAHCFDLNDSVQKRRLVSDYLHIAQCVPVYSLEYAHHFDQLASVGEAALAAAASDWDQEP